MRSYFLSTQFGPAIPAYASVFRRMAGYAIGVASAASAPSAAEGDTPLIERLPGFSRHRKMLFFSTYLLYICVNTVNGPLMPAMKTALNFTSGDGATIGAIQTVGISCGKLLNGGWPVDVIGARRTYGASMATISVLAFSYSAMQSASAVARVAFFLEFFSTPVYPCHVQFIRGWMVPEATGQGFWLLGMSSRAGDVLAKLSYGGLLSWLSWKQVTYLAAGLGLMAACLGLGIHRDTPRQLDAPGVLMTTKELCAVLRRMLGSSGFWLATSALSATCVIKRSLELLVALYFFDTSDIVSAGTAAQLAFVWSLGLAISLLVGGPLFNGSTDHGKRVLMAALNAVTVAGCLAMAMLTGAFADAKTASVLLVACRASVVFVTALGVGLPYYVPTGIFSVRFGGASSGVVSAYMDVVAFLVSAAAMAAIGQLLDSSPAGWVRVWLVLSVAALAMLALNFWLLRMLFPATSRHEARRLHASSPVIQLSNDCGGLET